MSAKSFTGAKRARTLCGTLYVPAQITSFQSQVYNNQPIGAVLIVDSHIQESRKVSLKLCSIFSACLQVRCRS